MIDPRLSLLGWLMLCSALVCACGEQDDSRRPSEAGTGSFAGVDIPAENRIAHSIDVIAFGSCADQNHQQPIWQAINSEAADLFVFLGDNIYGDSQDMAVLQEKYAKLAAHAGFAELRRSTATVAIWDDHDYGENDGGAGYPMKSESRRLMLDFWGEPEHSARRSRPDGIYTSYEYGAVGRRVQLILLDLRWNRGPLARVGAVANTTTRIPSKMGPYEPTSGPDAIILGEAQWGWLQQQLQRPADLRIIGSSIQLIPEFSGWESWANFPQERQRLLSQLKQLGPEPVMIISGDTHWSEFSRLDDVLDGPLWELTSSGLTEEWKIVSPNKHRIGEPYSSANYGVIEIDWGEKNNPTVVASIKNVNGTTVLQQRVR